MKKDGIVTVGVDDFLQHVAGRITRVELKKPGEYVKKGERLLTLIQNGKQLNIYSPLSGTIMAHNKELYRDASLVNAAPYADGWVYRIEPANWLRDIQFLSMAEKYKTWLKVEFSRLKDFFAVELNVNSPEYANVVLQDGGALKDNILAELGPEVWEDFQTQFIDCVR
jgi:glycine cleavage system H lipoate-binding protein